MGAYKIGISDFITKWDITFQNEFDGIGEVNVVVIALCKAPNFIAQSIDPYILVVSCDERVQ